MIGAEINSEKSEFRLYLGAKIVTAPAGAEIHSRLAVELNPKFWSEYSFSRISCTHFWI